FHSDHPVFSCSKIEQKQLNTWVIFRSAEQPLLGQFSVSGNNQLALCKACQLDEKASVRRCLVLYLSTIPADRMRLNVAFIEDLFVLLPMRLVLRASIIQDAIWQCSSESA
ncbi:hypothetical protein, partial [Pseudomonas sp.]|uniref:hypothetical protein n=1 Tax=Pseudomonas sp. TaxID=306 RepID=UPI002FC78881